MKFIYTYLFCLFIISVKAQVACKSAINVSLSAEGTATLSPIMLLNDLPEPGFIYTISPNRIYTCTDIGTPQYVTVTRSTLGGVFAGSCTTLITIEDLHIANTDIITNKKLKIRFFFISKIYQILNHYLVN